MKQLFFCHFQINQIAEVFQRKDHDQDNLIKIEMADVSNPSTAENILFFCFFVNSMHNLFSYSHFQWIKSVLRC